MDMENRYNVIWADDEVDILLKDMQYFFDKKGISVIPCNTAEDAFATITKDYDFIDGIIVDAKFSRDGSSFEDTGKSFPGLTYFIHHLESARQQYGKPLPCWILTGYGDLLRDKYDLEDLEIFEDIVDKKSPSIEKWLDEMCARIGECRSEEFLLRQSNPNLFTLCTEGFLGKERAHDLLSILKYEKKAEGEPPVVLIRNMVEEILDLMINKRVIPDGVDVQSKVSILPRALKLRAVAQKLMIPLYIPDALAFLCNVSSLAHSGTIEHRIQESLGGQNLVVSFIAVLRVVMEWLGPFLDSYEEEPISEVEDLLPGYHGGKLYPYSWFVKLDDGNRTAEIRERDTRSYKKGSDVQVKLSGRQNVKGLPIIEDIKPLRR